MEQHKPWKSILDPLTLGYTQSMRTKFELARQLLQGQSPERHQDNDSFRLGWAGFWVYCQECHQENFHFCDLGPLLDYGVCADCHAKLTLPPPPPFTGFNGEEVLRLTRYKEAMARGIYSDGGNDDKTTRAGNIRPYLQHEDRRRQSGNWQFPTSSEGGPGSPRLRYLPIPRRESHQ